MNYSASNDCRRVSKPALKNDLFWQNRSFRIDVVGTGSGNQSQQNLVALSPALNQMLTGACPTGAIYWDIGLRTDDVASGLLSNGSNKLAVSNSLYTSGDLGTSAVITPTSSTAISSTPVIAQWCNGAPVCDDSLTVDPQGPAMIVTDPVVLLQFPLEKVIAQILDASGNPQ